MTAGNKEQGLDGIPHDAFRMFFAGKAVGKASDEEVYELELMRYPESQCFSCILKRVHTHFASSSLRIGGLRRCCRCLDQTGQRVAGPGCKMPGKQILEYRARIYVMMFRNDSKSSMASLHVIVRTQRGFENAAPMSIRPMHPYRCQAWKSVSRTNKDSKRW